MALSKDIEKWGSGLKRIHEECPENGVGVEFSKLKSGFISVFHRNAEEKAVSIETREKTRVIQEENRITTQKPPRKPFP